MPNRNDGGVRRGNQPPPGKGASDRESTAMTRCCVMLAAGVILFQAPAGRAEEIVGPPGGGDCCTAPTKGGLLGVWQRCCAACETQPCKPASPPFVLSQTALGHRCCAAQDRAVGTFQTWWHTPCCPPFDLSQTKLGQRAQAWWQTPCRPAWTVAGSHCLGPIYDWVTYRPLPTPCCKSCTPCCSPPLYSFFLCGGLGNGCAGGCAPAAH
jgi:hypothetical protein